MRKILMAGLLLILMIAPLGCFSHTHTIGSGPHSGQEEHHIQWFALWGIITIADERDGGKLAQTTNCEITTKFTPLDALINFFTGLGTVYRRTIIIKK